MRRRSTGCLLFVFVLVAVQVAAGCPTLLGSATCQAQPISATAPRGAEPSVDRRSSETLALSDRAYLKELVPPGPPVRLLWDRAYGTVLDDFAWGLANCRDGGYAVIGSTRNFGATGLDVWLVRTDADGYALWSRTYGGALDEEGSQVIQCYDGGFLIAGSTRSFGLGGLDAWLIRTNAGGDVMWNQTYGGSLDDAAYTVTPCRNGGFAITGFTCSLGVGGSADAWIIQTDGQGTPLWNRTFGGAQEDACWSIAECTAGGFVLGGMTMSSGAGDMDFLLIRTNETGHQIWNQTWGGAFEDWGVCAVECRGGGFALAGSTYSFGAGDGDGWLIRTDANGQQLWNCTYGAALKDSLRWVVECPDGGFALAGDTYNYGAGGSDMWLVRTDEQGYEVWNETAGGWANDYGRTVVEGGDGILAIAGIAYNPAASGFDMYLACFGGANWTILVYMDADNDLEQYAFEDINSMELVGSTDGMSVIVFVDFLEGAHAPYTGAKCYRITQDYNVGVIGSPELVSPLPSEPDMADWQTLRDFIVFGQSYAPADRYLLVVWDHGEGFYGVCLDETSGHAMGIDELAQALSVAVERIDVVAFDACMMAQLEVAYQVRNLTDVLVFSEAGIPLTGFPYEDILAATNSTSPFTPEEMANLIVSNYIQAYAPGGRYAYQGRTDVCLSAVRTSSLYGVVGALDDLAGALMPDWFLDTYFDYLCHVRAATQSFDRPDFMDLGDFANHTADWLYGTPAQGYAQALRIQLYYAVFSEAHLEGLPGATGLALSFADTVERYSYHLNLTIAGCRWYDFMSNFTFVGAALDWAPALYNGTQYGYLDGPGDRFYFVVTPYVSGYYHIDMGHLWEGYDDDFDLYLQSENLFTLAHSESPRSFETIYSYLSAGETYYVLVESFSGTSVLYGLGIFYLTVSLDWVSTGPFDWLLAILGVISGAVVLFIVVLAIVYLAVRHDRTRMARTFAYLGAPARAGYEGRPLDVGRPPPSVALLCPYCGAPLEPNDVFCYSCGSRIPRP